MPKQHFVYMMSNQSRSLYVGVTNNIYRRWYQHRHGHGGAYCRRRHIARLVYVESCASPLDAIAHEKRIKAWTRAKRVALVATQNPGWVDLAVEWGWRRPPASAGPRRIV